MLRINLQAENGDVSAAEVIQSGIELRKMRIDFGSMVRSNQLWHNQSLAFGSPVVREPARPAWDRIWRWRGTNRVFSPGTGLCATASLLALQNMLSRLEWPLVKIKGKDRHGSKPAALLVEPDYQVILCSQCICTIGFSSSSDLQWAVDCRNCRHGQCSGLTP